LHGISQILANAILKMKESIHAVENSLLEKQWNRPALAGPIPLLEGCQASLFTCEGPQPKSWSDFNYA